MIYLMNCMQHRKVCFPDKSLFQNLNDNTIPFILSGEIQSPIVDITPLDQTSFIYGFLQYEDNTIKGSIYLDAIANYNILKHLLQEPINDTEINNMVNTIRCSANSMIGDNIEQACWCDFLQAAYMQDMEKMILIMKQLVKHWYLSEPTLTIDAIINRVHSRVVTDQLWKEVKSELSSLLVAYELQEFLSQLFLHYYVCYAG